MFGKSSQENYADIRPWVKTAVSQEETKPQNPMWKGEPSEEKIAQEQQKRIRFLFKHGSNDPELEAVAKRLESCRPRRRCLSGACLLCGRLLQRWFVRASKPFITKHLETKKGDLIAISIVPPDSMGAPGHLKSVSITNLRRRMKYALAKAGIDVAIGGIDFSFNEDRKGKYQPFWSPHLYVITATRKKNRLKKDLVKLFPKTMMTPRPIKISPFRNRAYRRSYALKTHFGRRIGYTQKKVCEGQVRKCRNTSRDKLRACERLELFLFLNQIGLASRPFFLGVKPHPRSERITFKRWG
jgi:hypothetical protein